MSRVWDEPGRRRLCSCGRVGDEAGSWCFFQRVSLRGAGDCGLQKNSGRRDDCMENKGLTDSHNRGADVSDPRRSSMLDTILSLVRGMKEWCNSRLGSW